MLPFLELPSLPLSTSPHLALTPCQFGQWGGWARDAECGRRLVQSRPLAFPLRRKAQSGELQAPRGCQLSQSGLQLLIRSEAGTEQGLLELCVMEGWGSHATLKTLWPPEADLPEHRSLNTTRTIAPSWGERASKAAASSASAG